MTMGQSEDLAPGATRLRLRTLIQLRWVAVVGQSATVLFVYAGLGFDLPLGFCFALIALSAWLNIFLRIRYRASHELSPRSATALLAYDALQLAALLALTGGLANPFSILLLVPVVISASTQPPVNTAMLVVITLAAATAIAALHTPLPWDGPPPEFPTLYIAGVWVALASALFFMSLYAFRVAEEAREMADALAAAELVLAREQHLSALDGLAAAAAHELGTPLATIALVTRELEREVPADSPHADDIRLLRSQVERCRGILERIGSLGAVPDGPLDRLPLTSLIEEIAAPHREFGVKVEIAAEGPPPEPVSRRNAAILYGLGNLVENAVDFARAGVTVKADWSVEQVTVEIVDDGPGFTPEILAKVGEPYLTSRGRRRRGGEESGLGLGLFIAKTLLERTGASLTVANLGMPPRGARVVATWPRPAFEMPATHRAALARAEESHMNTSESDPAGAREPAS